MPMMIPPKDCPQPYYGTTIVDQLKGIDINEYDMAALLAEGWSLAAIIMSDETSVPATAHDEE